MAITTRKNSKFYYSEFVLNGKRYIKSTKTTNRKQAEKIDQLYYQQTLDEVNFNNNNISLKDVFQRYIKQYDINSTYYRQISVVINWLNDNLDTSIVVKNIDTKWLYLYVEKRKDEVKPSTLKHNLKMLDRVIQFAKKLGYDTIDYQLPNVKVKNKNIKIFSKEDQEKLLEELKNPTSGSGMSQKNRALIQEWYGVTLLLFNTACRANEILELKWSQVDFNNKIVHIWRKKTSSHSVLPLTNEAYQYLLNREKSSIYVFHSEDDMTKPKRYNSISFLNACKRAGLDGYTFHSIRHTVISRACKRGMNIPTVQQLSGHRSQSSLARYIHLTTGDTVETVREFLNED